MDGTSHLEDDLSGNVLELAAELKNFTTLIADQFNMIVAGELLFLTSQAIDSKPYGSVKKRRLAEAVDYIQVQIQEYKSASKNTANKYSQRQVHQLNKQIIALSDYLERLKNLLKARGVSIDG